MTSVHDSANPTIPEGWRNHAWKIEFVHEIINKSDSITKLCSKDKKYTASVHTELLCFFSAYYAAALKGGFLESGKDELDIDLVAEDLQCFTTWIYTGQLFTFQGHDQMPAIRLYVFADCTNILALRRTIMDWIVRQKVLAKYKVIALAFSQLPDESALRQRMVDDHVRHWKPTVDMGSVMDPKYDEDALALKNFFFRVACGLKDVKPVNCRCCGNSCNYHEHESEAEWNWTCGTIKDAQLPKAEYFKPVKTVKNATVS